MSVCLSVYSLRVNISVILYLFHSFYLSLFCLSVCLSALFALTLLSFYLSLFLYLLSVCLSVCMFVLFASGVVKVWLSQAKQYQTIIRNKNVKKKIVFMSFCFSIFLSFCLMYSPLKFNILEAILIFFFFLFHIFV